MKRYFYTDPLAAAWMAKHFGMLIDCINPEYGSYAWQFPTVYSSDESFILSNYQSGEVAPGSLHLLKPQPGDMIVLGDSRQDVICGAIVQQHGGKLLVEDMGESWPITDSQKIIQRGGKAFMWPESETV